MNPEYAVIARKYAYAYLKCADTSFDEHDFKYAGILKKFLRTNRRILFLLDLPMIDAQASHAAIEYISTSFHAKEIFKKLVSLLVEEGRTFLLPDILHHIEDIYKQNKNSMVCTITSSHELTDEQLRAMLLFLERKSNKHIMYECKVDQSLIAGIKLSGDTMLWEYSIQHKLAQIKQALLT